MLRFRRYALFLSGAAFVAGGLMALACSSDSTAPTAVPGVDANKNDGSVSETGTTDAPNDQQTSVDCSLAPVLHDNTNGFYCSFLFRDAGPDGASGPYCANTETCCNPAAYSDGGHAATFCATGKGSNNEALCLAQAGTNNSAWPVGGKFPGVSYACNDSRNCSAGQKCCMFTQADSGTDHVNIGTNLDTNIPKACDAKQAFKQGGTYCAATCTAGTEIQLCYQDSECSGGTKCQPFEAFSNRELGSCR